MPANASNIPTELLRNILYFVTIDSHGNPKFASWELLNLGREDKQDILACTLTCSDWAKQCRFLLFQRITLRSAEDVRMLVSFVTTPPSSRFASVSHYIEFIGVEYAMKGMMKPWLHHIYPLLQLLGHPYKPKEGSYLWHKSLSPSESENAWSWTFRSPGWLSLEVIITSHHDETTHLWRSSSFHSGLPRRLPSCYHAFETLKIAKVHLHSLPDLLRAIKELKMLRELELRDVIWEKSPIVGFLNPVRFGLRLGRSRLHIEASGCTDDSLVAFLVLSDAARVRTRQANLPMDRGDVMTIKETIECVCASGRSLQQGEDSTVSANSWVHKGGSKSILTYAAHPL